MNAINRVKFRAEKIAKQITFILFSERNRLIQKIFVQKPVITILGSCRQDSIYKYFKVTNIRDGLTYPHYAKEVIQTIEYCKNPKLDVPGLAFRNNQLRLKVPSRKSLKKSFYKTDIFVIEIASMLEYQYEGAYLHHEIYDNPDLKSAFASQLTSEVVRREQTESELIRDLDRLVALIGKDRIIFSSHINTRSEGRRALLSQTLKDFCAREDIPLFMPEKMLENYQSQELFVEERVLSHFTDFGHRIAGYRYKELIELLQTKRGSWLPPLVQTLSFPPEKRHEFTSGLGDYLYGSLKVFEIGRKLRRLPLVDFSSSVFCEHLENKYTSDSKGELVNIHHDDSDLMFAKSKTVFTNKRPQTKITDESRDFVLRNCLSQKISIRSKLEETLNFLDINSEPYEVLHVRVDDKFDDNPNDLIFEKISQILLGCSDLTNKRVIALSNSNRMRAHLKSLGFSVPEARVQHSADPRATAAAIENTLVEFFIILRAQSIIQLSTYEWGSGFSSLAGEISGIPLTRIKLDL